MNHFLCKFGMGKRHWPGSAGRAGATVRSVIKGTLDGGHALGAGPALYRAARWNSCVRRRGFQSRGSSWATVRFLVKDALDGGHTMTTLYQAPVPVMDLSGRGGIAARKGAADIGITQLIARTDNHRLSTSRCTPLAVVH